MKKIFLFSLIVCMGIVDVGFAADKGTYNCRVQSIAALSKKKSNEFLFPTNGDYKDANGRALVCGHRGTDGCTNGTTVVVAGNHWFQKSQSDYMKVYRCSTGGGNAWADVGYTALNECSSSQKENWNKIGEIQGQKILCADKIDTFYRGGYCKNACFTSDCTDCNKPEPTPQPAPTPTPQPDPTPTPTPGKKTCAERYAGYPERIACCEAGSATEWIGDLQNGKCLCKRLKIDGNEIPLRPVLSLGEVSGKMTAQCIPNIRILAAKCCIKKGGRWIAEDETEATGHCDCGSGKTFRYSAPDNLANPPVPEVCECVDGGGNNTPVTPTECTPSDCYLSINQTVRCNNGNYWKSNERINICKEQLTTLNTCSDLQSKITSCQDVNCINNIIGRIDAYDELIERVCDGSGVVTTPVPDNGAEILAAENTLTSFFRNAESNASVWKDKDGNFNTARLASDLTAGVILGTVGGVVSGVVIKKKQVEKGFDALHCTVGGQTVADWGDIFNVGLRR